MRLSGDRALPADFAAVLLAPLSREPGYATCPVVAAPEAHAVVFAPRLSFAVSGSTVDAASGIRAGYFGEFFGPDFPADDSAAIAQKLIELYRAHGAGFPARLDGTFAGFVWDPAAGEALLFNDHYASRPVCYAEQNGFLYFSPEPKGIARLPEARVRTNEAALIMALTHGHLLGDATYYQEIRYLPPGSTLRIRAGKIELTRYFEYLVNEEPGGADSPELLDGLAAAMRQAIRKRARHVKDMVIPISGGYDSRGILAMLREIAPGPIRTVSWGVEEDTPDTDAYIGRHVAAFFGTEHRFIPRRYEDALGDAEEMVERVDAGSVDAIMHPNELGLMRMLRHELGSDYLLRGDEIFGFKGEAATETEALARVGLQELSQYPDIVRLLHPDRRAEFQAISRAAVEEAQAACPLRRPNPRKDYFHFNHKIRNFANRSNYYKLGILEAANPWLDRTVVEFLRTLPAPCRIDKVLYRRTLAAAFPQLMSIPIAQRNSLEDFGALMKRSAAFQKFIRFHLLEGNNRLHEMVDRQHLEGMLAAAFQGRRADSLTVRLYGNAKRLLKQASPGLYRKVRAQAHQSGKVMATLPTEWLVLRLLLLKLCCDRLP